MLQSYDVEIVCGDRRWTETRVIAREGSGPGEIGPYGTLLTWAAGSVAYRDGANTRVSFFSEGLDPVGSVRVPGGFPVMASSVDGVMALQGLPSPSGVPQLRVRRLELATGAEVEEQLLALDPGDLDRDSVILNGAVATPDGGFLARLRAPGWDALAWFDGDGTLVDRTELPEYGTVYPSERDIEEMADGVRRLQDLAGGPVLEGAVRRFRERPLGFFPRGSPTDVLAFDGEGRLWARSTRPSDLGSYFAVFEDRRYAGSLEVPGRVRAFQVLDTLLVAMVEDVAPDSVGIYPRRLDWYRIVDAGPNR